MIWVPKLYHAQHKNENIGVKLSHLRLLQLFYKGNTELGLDGWFRIPHQHINIWLIHL